jgi:FtsP/CotA-like multicopper oxidase with cupredoxin domain
VKLAADGALAGPWTERDIAMGRQGNVLLINGAAVTNETALSIRATSGSRERWHLVNAANGRFFRLELEGIPLEVVGWDGGLIDEPYTVDSVLVAPGERYDVLAPIDATQGALEVWEVQNEAEGDHPFHLHGMFFQVMSSGGVVETRLGWKDTAVVPAHSSLRFAVRYDAPGAWMYHCQIPEHADRGMMGEVRVTSP